MLTTGEYYEITEQDSLSALKVGSTHGQKLRRPRPLGPPKLETHCQFSFSTANVLLASCSHLPFYLQ